jgi:hypothetical protein
MNVWRKDNIGGGRAPERSTPVQNCLGSLVFAAGRSENRLALIQGADDECLGDYCRLE